MIFKLSKSEKESADEFIKSIDRPRSYKFSKTVIGDKILVIDDLTGSEKDISDYDSW